MLNYLLNLYKQYCRSVGKDYEEFNIFGDKDFKGWLNDLKDRLTIYSDYLKTSGISLNPSEVVELDKGLYDSFESSLVRIVSPYASSMNLPNETINFSGSPIIDGGVNMEYIDKYGLFLTHNPYSIGNIDSILKLSYEGFNTCLGVFGKTFDNDKEQKIKFLYDLSNYLKNSLKTNYNVDSKDDNYFGLLKINNK